MFMKDSDNESEDEWFHDSIKRYKQLRMFDVENVINQIELSDASSICVVGEHRSGNNEILELLLPDKITVAACQEGLVKNSNLKMKGGGYITAPVTQMRTLWNQKKIIVSVEGQASASLYNLGSEESGLITRASTLKCDLVSPLLAVKKGLVLLAAKDKGDIILLDIDKNQVVYKSVIENEAKIWLEPCFVSESLAALCNRYTSSVTLHDMRMSKPCSTISYEDGSKVGELWTMGISQDTSNNAVVGLLSRLGKLVTYDLRSPQVSSCSCDIGKVCKSNKLAVPSLTFSPDSSDVVSVSGFDDRVYVFNMSQAEQLRTVFVHDGHKYHCNCVEDSSVTCHIWYRDNTIISASGNSSLHCWQFIPQTL